MRPEYPLDADTDKHMKDALQGELQDDSGEGDDGLFGDSDGE